MKSLRIVIILIVATFCSIASIEAQIEDPINKERITNIIKNQLGAPSLPDEVTNSFFNKSKTKEWANLLIDKMSELKDLEDDDPERGKLNRGIDRYSKRIVEEYNDHWNDMVLKNGALPNYNIASTFPGLQKDIESMITSLSKGCQPKAREFIKDPVIKINKWVNEIEKLRSYKNDVDKFVLDSSSEPCDFLIKSKMKSFLANQAAVNRIKKETETFESDLLLKVISLKKCLDEIRKSYYFKNVKKYKNVTFKQIEYLKNEFELIDEWRKENICEEEADAEECRAMLNASKKEYFEFEASLGFNQLGVNKYKIKELINRDGRYACAEDDIKTAFDNLDLSPLENTDYAGKLNAILNSLNNNFSGLNCNKSISNEVESFREVIKGKTLRLDLQKKDLKEEISEIEQWIKDHPCDEKQAEEKEDDCPDKMIRNEKDKCVCMPGYTKGPYGDCVSIQDLLDQSLADSDQDKKDCVEIAKAYGEDLDAANYLLMFGTEYINQKAEIALNFLSDPNGRHCCNGSLATALRNIRERFDELDLIWQGSVERLLNMMAIREICMEETKLILEQVSINEKLFSQANDITGYINTLWSNYNCTDEDLSNAITYGMNDPNLNPVGVQMGATGGEIPCDGIDNDGDGEIDETEDAAAAGGEEEVTTTTYYGVQLSGVGVRKRFGGIVNEYIGDMIIIFTVEPGEDIDSEIAAFETWLLDKSDAACKGPIPLCPCAWYPDIWTGGPDLVNMGPAFDSWGEAYAHFDTGCKNADNNYPCINWDVVSYAWKDKIPSNCE